LGNTSQSGHPSAFKFPETYVLDKDGVIPPQIHRRRQMRVSPEIREVVQGLW